MRYTIRAKSLRNEKRAAALLHYLLEDQPAFTEELRERMPGSVIETVLASRHKRS